MATRIVDFDRGRHLQAVRDFVIQLQDFEGELESRLPAGADIASDYLKQMFDRCRQCNGKVFVADVDGEVAGFVVILTKVSSGELADGDIEYALIADLYVAEHYRRQGLGQQLIESGEAFAVESEAQWLRIAVLAANRAALDLYQKRGFQTLFVEMEKRIA